MNGIDLRTDAHLLATISLNNNAKLHIWQAQGEIHILGLWADGREWISMGVPDTPPPGSTPPDPDTIAD